MTARTPIGNAAVCVIGAGPAGALIADRLADAGREVVVLEAGPRFDPADRLERMERSIRPAHGPPDVWETGGNRDAYSDSGERPYPLNHARVKGVGGTTLHWQGMVMRLHEDDFRSESARGVGVDWPISYEELRPHYAGAESELGVAGADDNPFGPPREEPFPMPAFPPSYSDSLFTSACEDLEIATHSVPNARNSAPYDGRGACAGYGTCQPVCPSRAKYDATVHVERAEKKGATVIDRAPVRRLEHDADRITAARYTIPGGETHRQEADAFVVACGGVETPRLLLLSASQQYPDGLANTSGLVGRYFTEHLFAGMGGTLDEQTRQNHVGFLTSESHQFYDEADDELAPFKLEFLNYAGPSPVEEALAGDDWGDPLLERLRGSYGTHLGVGALVEQLPSEDSYVGLDPDVTDDRGDPVPEIHWSIDERALRTLERANDLQRAILEELDAEITWRVGPENTGPAFHHMGTTRMGADPADSVVDPDLRTHDLSNCWIVSSSVFPTGGALNPTLTIAALALRAADRIDVAL
ncbi:GMC family oxidoreductase [Halalkalicoccus jeotgali]|uniref:Glucose-methanol-choline oxidoreductase n=1 Tax=Halalkalicoccus jeotgali (strain DSM 18796 / CECT 7217 / JCM 14584 / KCTC 4019 / B3) TaxID=795797 RepID=D8J3K1_HALJB|nr:GMC family oxidoreductase [Halalkalicoccus jeotgali]ADJ15308.1 glucose-methanol-choline oxidoreductase [Halalkalicoccus jeotgali B3]ELY35479.1 glucose-methanol-choline oxidoreductase [Halalkalicoccus jeotgali B3]